MTESLTQRAKKSSSGLRGATLTTRELILEVAEQIFAERGIDGVSLRELAQATGQANNSAIQYHFGSKAGLANAILKQRIADIDTRVQELLDEAQNEDDPPSVRTFIEILFRPIAEIVDENGRHVHAGFQLQYLTHPQYDFDYIDPDISTRAQQSAAQLLLNSIPGITWEKLVSRLFTLNGMFVSALVRRDSERGRGTVQDDDELFMDNLLNMMVSALCAPFRAP